MCLDFEYLKLKMHLGDLHKLNDKELSFIIRLLQAELDEFNINDGYSSKGLIKECNETTDLFKDFRFILNEYINAIEKYDLSFCDKTNTERLINKIDSINDNLKTILETKITKLSKNKFVDLMDECILNMRVFYGMMDDYITEEYNLWEGVKSIEERINKRECYMNQDKFNTDKQ